MMGARALARLMRNSRGSGSAEFALVLVPLILLLVGALDLSRIAYLSNAAQKATQMGARFAIVTDLMPSQLLTADYVGKSFCGTNETTVCTNGDLITSRIALGPLTCNSVSCTCATGATCPASAAIGATAFTGLFNHMAKYYPGLAATNIEVIYTGSGLGYAGDPTGMDVVPLVTVRLKSLTYAPASLLSVARFTLPSFPTTLSQESAVGNLSN